MWSCWPLLLFREPPTCGSSRCSASEEYCCRRRRSAPVCLWISGSSLAFRRGRSPQPCSLALAATSGRKRASESSSHFFCYSVAWNWSKTVVDGLKVEKRRLCLNWQDVRPVPCYRRLQYKYSKLVDSSGNKECELPTADSCAIMEGEDAEDDIMYFTKKPFFSKIKSYSREVSGAALHANTPGWVQADRSPCSHYPCVYRGRQTDLTRSPWSLHRHSAWERRGTLKMNNSRMMRVLFFFFFFYPREKILNEGFFHQRSSIRQTWTWNRQLTCLLYLWQNINCWGKMIYCCKLHLFYVKVFVTLQV